MKSPAVCLRCDWQGSSAEDDCPECGAPLFRPSAAPSAGRSATPEPSVAREHQAVLPVSEPEPESRSRPLLILGTLVVLAIVAAFVSSGADAPGPAAPSAPTWHPTGSIIFAAAGSRDRVLLWRWDLSTGRYVPGPLLGGPVRLVDAEGVAPGALGIVSPARDGGERASLLRIFGRSDRPEPVIRGQLVSWPSGSNVAVASSPATTAGCRGSTISSVNLATGLRSRDLHICGTVTALGRAGVSTFFAVRSDHAVRIDFVGFHRAHVVLRGYDLRSVSPATDLIVTPGSGPSPDAALFWEGNRPQPVPYADAHDPLVLRDVLAWSPDSSSALVEGSLGDRSGVWSLQAGAGTDTGPRAPTPILGDVGSAWATYASDGTAYLVADSRVYSLRKGRLTPVELPSGMPAPSGPLVWLR
jgi:hypothetical protein